MGRPTELAERRLPVGEPRPSVAWELLGKRLTCHGIVASMAKGHLPAGMGCCRSTSKPLDQMMAWAPHCNGQAMGSLVP